MLRLCKVCNVEKSIEDYYLTNAKTGRRELECKRCRMDKRKTPERRAYIKNYRAIKKAKGDYGKCSVCSSHLGRNEHKDRQKLGKCKNCITLDNHWNWAGGKTTNKDGYVIVRFAPSETMLEHRYVMEQHLGRSLTKDETVHHINGDRQDNRVENLEIWVGAPVRGIRVPDAIAWAKEIIERYDND